MVDLAELAEPKHLRRVALALVGAAVVVLAGLAVRASIAVDAARGEVEAHLSALTGVPLRLDGPATARLLPWPQVAFRDVVLAATDGRPAARMDSLVVSLDVAALLLGRSRPEAVRLVRPRIRVTPDGAIDLRSLADLLAHWQTATVAIDDGSLVVATADGEETFDGLTASLAWPRPTANLDLRAGFRWRGEAVTLGIETPSPALLLEGGTGTAKLRLAASTVRLAVSGSGGLWPTPHFEGDGDVELVDAARFARWTGIPRTRDLLAGRLRLAGHAVLDARGATLSEVRADLAGNTAEGVLTCRWDQPRPRLGGTLAFAAVDLVGRGRPVGPGWREIALDRKGLAYDLDLRLSTPSLKLPGVTLERVAASVLVAEGRLNAEIGSADLFAKPVSVVVRGTLEPDGLKARIRASGDDLPLADIAGLADVPGIEAGRTAVKLDAETRCPRLGSCAAATEGRLTATVLAAKVTGVAPFADVSRFHPIVPNTAGTEVTAAWDRGDVDLRFIGPRATVDRVEITGPGSRFLLSGAGDLSTGALDLVGHAYFPAQRPDPARVGPQEIAFPVRVGGTLRKPEVTARDRPATGTEPPPAPTAP